MKVRVTIDGEVLFTTKFKSLPRNGDRLVLSSALFDKDLLTVPSFMDRKVESKSPSLVIDAGLYDDTPADKGTVYAAVHYIEYKIKNPNKPAKIFMEIRPDLIKLEEVTK